MQPDDYLLPRLIRLESTMERYHDELNHLKIRQDAQHDDMQGIAERLDTLNATISRGQWIIIGATGFFLLENMGLSEFLKKVLL
jgi:hypothetical protein